ncbi:MAG: hypothetical protein LBP76_00750 [Treponema sp.]|jgi:hypothetical protein|nr:hypothetical protein [Treponema sp.]
MNLDNYRIGIVSLASGEHVGLGVIEVTAIPHISVLQKSFPIAVNINTEYKQDMARLLSEIFQNSKITTNSCQDISLEILWSTQEVKNQPYKASITLHIIIRASGNNDTDIKSTISSLLGICKTNLDFGKYDYRDADINELISRVRGVESQSVKAIVKNEGLELLQNSVMPCCFAFDKIPATENDMSHIVSSLIDCPGAAILFS